WAKGFSSPRSSSPRSSSPRSSSASESILPDLEGIASADARHRGSHPQRQAVGAPVPPLGALPLSSSLQSSSLRSSSPRSSSPRRRRQPDASKHHAQRDPEDDAVVAAVTVEHPARPPGAQRRAQAEAEVEQPEDSAQVSARELVGDGG